MDTNPYLGRYSPYPFRRVPPSEKLASVHKGMNQFQFISAVYKASYEGFSRHWSFLSRDMNLKPYIPSIVDPFVFSSSKGEGSPSAALDLTLSRYLKLLAIYKEMKLPVKFDSARRVDVPDTELLFSIFADKSHKLHGFVVENFADITHLISNIDILLKFSINRKKRRGWWMVDYRAKRSVVLPLHIQVLQTMLSAWSDLLHSHVGKSAYDYVLSLAGDPLESSIGAPLFTAKFKDGVPESKLEALDMAQGIARGVTDFSAITKNWQARQIDPILARHPWPVSCIRRISAGYKVQHEWIPSSTSLILDGDTQGEPTVRVAWNESWLMNLFLSPAQFAMKTIRYITPGLYHDGSSRKYYLDKRTEHRPFTVESDFSNYDRGFPFDHVTFLYKGLASLFTNPTYFMEINECSRTNRSIFWPIQGSNTYSGVAFRSDVALLSGKKTTSDEGTLLSAWICYVALIKAGYFSLSQLKDYIKGKLLKPKDYDIIVGIQSDDVEFSHCDASVLARIATAFNETASEFGYSAKAEIADRFLMRHVGGGKDSPVIERIWQNTISQEKEVKNELIYIVGFLARTDGMLGYKSIDAFNSGDRSSSISRLECYHSKMMLEDLVKIFSSSNHPSQVCIDHAQDLIKLADLILSGNASSGAAKLIKQGMDKRRREMSLKLAKFTNVSLFGSDDPEVQYISSLRKDRYSMSSLMTLDALKRASPSFAQWDSSIDAKEQAFYHMATKTLGLNPTLCKPKIL